MDIETAMKKVRDPKILNDDSKLRELLQAVYQQGKRASGSAPKNPHTHGMIAFNDGIVVTI